MNEFKPLFKPATHEEVLEAFKQEFWEYQSHRESIINGGARYSDTEFSIGADNIMAQVLAKFLDRDTFPFVEFGIRSITKNDSSQLALDHSSLCILRPRVGCSELQISRINLEVQVPLIFDLQNTGKFRWLFIGKMLASVITRNPKFYTKRVGEKAFFTSQAFMALIRKHHWSYDDSAQSFAAKCGRYLEDLLYSPGSGRQTISHNEYGFSSRAMPIPIFNGGRGVGRVIHVPFNSVAIKNVCDFFEVQEEEEEELLEAFGKLESTIRLSDSIVRRMYDTVYPNNFFCTSNHIYETDISDVNKVCYINDYLSLFELGDLGGNPISTSISRFISHHRDVLTKTTITKGADALVNYGKLELITHEKEYEQALIEDLKKDIQIIMDAPAQGDSPWV